MNDYYKVSFNFNEYTETESDILSAFLCDAGYDSFEQNPPYLDAYIKAELFSENDIKSAVNQYPFNSVITYKTELIPGQDWNQEWEKNYFQPIILADKCIVHSTQHTDIPKLPYDIIINPRMSFGTGHHETTTMMVETLFENDLAGKNVFDMGAGTGILSILCSKLGAKYVKGIEIDPGAQINAVENIELNKCSNIDILLGDASLLAGEDCRYDLFLANINRNIILNDIDKYSRVIKKGGKLQLSGFYIDDIEKILAKAKEYDFELVSTRSKNDWAVVLLIKK